MGEERKMTTEEKEAAFKSVVEDCVELARKLSPHCKNVTEFVGLLTAALEQSKEGNDALLRLMMTTVAGGAPKRQ